MQPENTQIGQNLEQVDIAPSKQAGERIPVLPTIEAPIETAGERQEQGAEIRAARADAASSSATPAVSAPDPVPADDVSASAASTLASPPLAADEDLIEKEWIDSSKKIISETQGNPHSRSAKVTQLHEDYLRKRYGKNLGATSS